MAEIEAMGSESSEEKPENVGQKKAASCHAQIMPISPRTCHCKFALFLYLLPVSTKTKAILKGMIPIIGVAVVLIVMSLLANAPGLTGEIFAKMLGFMFTPFFLEASFAFLGIIALFWVNHVRLKAEGDEFVTLEISDDKNDPQP